MDDIHRQHPINIKIDPCRPDPKKQQLETIEDRIVHILEDRWFFSNLLGRQPRISRRKSDPCPSSFSSPLPPPPPSTKKEETSCFSMLSPTRLGDEKTNMIRGHGNHGLHRTPSPPVTFSREGSGVIVEEDADGDPPRMADLIIQAMPMPRSRLVRAPSLPPYRVVMDKAGGDQVSAPTGQKKNPPGIGRLTRRATIDSSKPTRRMTSMDSSIPLPSPSRSSNFKDMKPAKLEPSPNFSNCVVNGLKPRNLHRSKSLMSTHELQIEELQGFKDLGFSFDKKEDICPSVASIIPGLNKEFRDSDDQTKSDDKVRRPYLSEAWENQCWSPPVPPLAPKWALEKQNILSEDMKARIKFWARSVASNARQEC